MALNLNIVGKKSDPVPFTYDKDRVILYALGIGAGMDEFNFIYEKNLQVIPTFAVVSFMSSFLEKFLTYSNINLYGLLHGEHEIILHRPIPISGTLYTSTLCKSIFDKGDKGAVLNINFETRNESGDLIFENQVLVVDLTAGNFGGERGPKKVVMTPPEDKAPDFSVSYKIPLAQCALYRLSGDKNPLHIDPEFAKKVGFNRPILHGLCSMGYSCRAILHSICQGDPNRMKSFSVRFVNAVYPGDTLTTQGWKTGLNQYIIQTINQDGKIVLGNAMTSIN